MQLFTALAGALALAAQAPPTTDLNRLDTLDRPSPVAASAGVVAWSKRDARGRFRLVVTYRGRKRFADIPSRPVPFDVDAGRGPGGRPHLVYSRCTREPRLLGAAAAPLLPEYVRGRGCDLYAYDVARTEEVRVAALSTRGASEVLPSISGRRIAFARVPRGGSARLYVGAMGGGATRSRPGGPVGAPGPVQLDLDGPWLASVWRTKRIQEVAMVDAQDVRFVADRASRRGTRLGGAAFEGGILFYRSTCIGAAPRCPERHWGYRWPTSTRPDEHIFASDSRDVVASVHGNRNTYVLLGTDNGDGITCTEAAPCPLVVEDSLTYEKVPRL